MIKGSSDKSLTESRSVHLNLNLDGMAKYCHEVRTKQPS